MEVFADMDQLSNMSLASHTFHAPFCYLPPQKRANHVSGNAVGLVAQSLKSL
ncbi:Uncharacterized protein ALO43_01482 [Pseudomonas tremae]|uniref:Uncharacterized protein n=2 Tax=Pseudomonas syringae group TaxID=136849 RepID=A0AB37QUH3_9PSED|nr:Uncharacterized protein AC511_0074 [Pseudomonas coronafaciens pv. oryzae]KPX29255.1 Uncharacterized protein ALO77_02884 [Pseudomonas coronafaciens pv. garcae]KPY21378.1 Uncharacterized protein ALO89_04101 [Pseudomonas coronafaciens pv. porri]KPY95121.1 Uncharacterized protein ALO43_01482 [Pseudomonas tremae]KPZ22345.1 Uncharacterized protein ALO38_01076 [Pseudomonas coronafaciens pv. zizaniae]RMP29114.1 hypothetical protein ALQ25_02135 [Pseudomonas coronafaciens pv. atropurpurea]RMU95560.1